MPGLPAADVLADDLRLLAPASGKRIIEFLPPIESDRSSLASRIQTIAALKAWEIKPYPLVIVASYPALAAPVGIETQKPLVIDPENGKPITYSRLVAELPRLGYERVPTVFAEGEWSVRGGVIDVFPIGANVPARLDFFGEDLESVRSDYGRVEIHSIAQVGAVAEKTRSVFDFLPPNAGIVAFDHNAYELEAAMKGRFSAFPVLYIGDPPPNGVPSYDFRVSPLPGFAELGAGRARHPELFRSARERLLRHIDAAKKGGSLVVEIDDLSGGFETGDLVVVAKSDRVFTRPRSAPKREKFAKESGERLDTLDDIEPGEYVVHVDYGIGRYIGSSEILAGGERTEVHTIEYADGAKLHIPVAHAHLLSRYVGVKGKAVELHSLGGKRWEREKDEAKKAVADLAASLLETQAKRQSVPGFAYETASDDIDAFEAAFPFEETEDQRAAIADVKKDMAAKTPMDRLVCGDAGYGKTEVAMRAAFIAAMNGRQTALLAPTTVLVEQHYETFVSRFANTPVRIERVSRFQKGSMHKGTFERLANGVCDIVIGTHAILSEKIAFKNLGLVVIDEEQRFGVRHKEFLKRLRTTADVLTLSATPIPRTLYLSMTGLRDLSLLRTPPRERVAVETRIVRDNDDTIRDAIRAELANGGQVFFLHNRVNTMSRIEKRLRTIVPDVRIVVAHGQMDSQVLAKKMRAFEKGEYDVLLSTTIIGSGIDIPRANTIIVHDAQTFGLADLYQLRGRVGRSSAQGRAIFLLPPSGIVDAEARERLDAIKRHGSLGAGFNLAMRDLELRGSGNLLGAQQSGHIAAIGFNLYCRLLRHTIKRLKEKKTR